VFPCSVSSGCPLCAKHHASGSGGSRGILESSGFDQTTRRISFEFSEHREDVATAKSCATCRRVADYTIGGSSSKGQRSRSADRLTADSPSSPQPGDEYLFSRSDVCGMWVSFCRPGGNLYGSQSWPDHQIIARGTQRWLIRVYLGRDHETKKRKYHNRTIHGSMREAQAYLTKKLRERDLGRDLESAKITLNEYLDRWLETAVKPRVREKTCQDYDGMLRRTSGLAWVNSFGDDASFGRPNHLPADDRARAVCSNHPLRTCGFKVCDAAGVPVAPLARESCRRCQNPAATPRRNAVADRGASADIS